MLGRLGAALLALLALLAGCGGVEPEAAPDRDPDALTIILPREAQELDPRFVADPYGLKVSRLIFASLVTIDPRSLEVVPDLARDVEIESETVYRVTLREGLRFSDGSALDAEDVVATFEGIVDPELESLYARTYRRIAKVEAESPTVVRFELEAPHATFLTDLEVPIVRAEDARRRIAEPGGPMPVGAGPYRLVERAPGHLLLEAQPHWHGRDAGEGGSGSAGEGRAPHHARVKMVVIRDDNTRALRLLAGAGDVALNAIPPLLLPLFEESEAFEVRSAPGVGTTYLGFHTEHVPHAVREAIAHAVDREALVRWKLNGRAHLAESWVPSGHWAAVDLPARPHDLARAEALLDEAGLAPDGEGIRAELVLRTSSDRFRLSLARAIAGMLRRAGLAVRVQPSEQATLIADLNAGRFDLCLLQVPEVFEPHVLSWFFASERIPEQGRVGANRWRLADPALDAALERGRRRTDRAARQAAYADVQRILHRELPVLPLFQEDTVAVVRRGVDFDVPRDGRFGTLAR
ncbi:MAG TPA: ABC transporter substrate-binding protein [Polyangiaceae bacterium LLY-WYZ-15_(1-7)]|nr:ABC transporter substrate-binding protein [Polyangiaceae bacterium LLY-WYZ-15_(1-7)]HJL01703.1 ABC transporter substrate-binding protein [Polyangiaceae bacterium LLY-WYZ-15_(1-7)]HJL08939.1 ABC transporter substrate-binding protein [Polyangiaceae bacterium LLY-WYZ-15_(1-7)]HJL50300.1 ABC transporter substrate-binding protein [Polyangiaceae bacterium LLY-WYZ-15_(1-7)]